MRSPAGGQGLLQRALPVVEGMTGRQAARGFSLPPPLLEWARAVIAR